MRERRKIRPIVVDDYNEAVKCINEKALVIYITGSAYNMVKQEVKKGKVSSKISKGLGWTLATMGGIIILTATGPILGPVAVGTGAFSLLLSKDEFKKYKIKENKEKNRLEMIRVKGNMAFDPAYDTIEF